MAKIEVDIKPKVDWSESDDKFNELKDLLQKLNEWEEKSKQMDFIISEVIDNIPICCRNCNSNGVGTCCCSLPYFSQISY